VSGTVKLDYIRDKFRDINLGPGGTITLLRDDGIVIVRNVDTRHDTKIGNNWKSIPLFTHLAEQPSGVYHTENSADGVPRIYAYERIGNLPLVISVGLSKQGVLGPWWSKIVTLAAVYLLMAASVILLVSLFVNELVLRRKAANVQARLARRDMLTQLGNRREFEETLSREWRRAARGVLPLSLIIFDIDRFKLYNDTYGHLEGDRVIAEVARVMADVVQRPSDLAARYGGEELAAILPETDEDGALKLAEIVRQKVVALALNHSGSDHQIVTISGGVATIVPTESETPDALVKLADIALYAAKCEGRNKVVASSSREPQKSAAYSKVA
jgi:diguanylate cyclase (GGDEF)-like protein